MATDKKAHEMSQSTTDTDIAGRIGWFARMAWPNSRAKNLANMLGISESQAKRILAGEMPTGRQIAIMTKAWGWRFLHFVYEGVAGPIRPLDIMHREMNELDKRLARLEQERSVEDARQGVALSDLAVSGGSTAPGVTDRGVVRPDAAEADPVATRKRG